MKKFLLIFGAALLVVALSAGSAYFVLLNVQTSSTEALAFPEQRDRMSNFTPVTYTIGRIVTNLADKERSHFIQVDVEIWVDDEETKKLLQEYQAEARSLLISILRSTNSEEIEGAEGMEQLAEMMKMALSTLPGGNRILAVHFTEFLIQ